MTCKILLSFTFSVFGICYSQEKNDSILEQTVYGFPEFWNLEKELCESFVSSYSNGQPMIKFDYGEKNTPVSYATYFFNGDTALYSKLIRQVLRSDTVALPLGSSKYQSSDTSNIFEQQINDIEALSFYSNGQIRQYSTQSEMSEISHGYSDNGELIYSKIIIARDTTCGLFFASNQIRNNSDKHPDTYYVLTYYQNKKLKNYIEVTLDHSITHVRNSKRELIKEDETIEFFTQRIKFLLNY